MLRAHRRAHRPIWLGALIVIPVILALGWLSRPAPSALTPECLSSTQGRP